MKSLIENMSPYWLWLLLALPAAGFAASLVGNSDPKVFEELLHPTGEVVPENWTVS